MRHGDTWPGLDLHHEVDERDDEGEHELQHRARLDDDEEADEHEAAAHLHQLPPEVGRLVVLVQEGERAAQRRRPLRDDGLARREEEQRVHDQQADGEDCDRRPGRRLDGIMILALLTHFLTDSPLGRGAYDPRCRPRRPAALSSG